MIYCEFEDLINPFGVDNTSLCDWRFEHVINISIHHSGKLMRVYCVDQQHALTQWALYVHTCRCDKQSFIYSHHYASSEETFLVILKQMLHNY